MKKNAKMLPKVNNDGGRKNYESTSVIRRSRQIKRQMYEESTDNHGASHHVKVFVETVTDTVGAIKANVIDADSVLAFIKGKVNIPTNDASNNIEDAEFEEIPDLRTESLALPLNERKCRFQIWTFSEKKLFHWIGNGQTILSGMQKNQMILH